MVKKKKFVEVSQYLCLYHLSTLRQLQNEREIILCPENKPVSWFLLWCPDGISPFPLRGDDSYSEEELNRGDLAPQCRLYLCEYSSL